MNNTVGSTSTNFCNFFSCPEDAYILGLWCADSYWWSSSIGLSNTDSHLIEKFREFLKRKGFAQSRIRFNRNHIFVNSRPLLREFRHAQRQLKKLQKAEIIAAYLAGRFDGDGCVNRNVTKYCRIVYGKRDEAEFDRSLLAPLGVWKSSIYYYRTSSTYCLYIWESAIENFAKKILPYSLKLQKLVLVPPRDLSVLKYQNRFILKSKLG